MFRSTKGVIGQRRGMQQAAQTTQDVACSHVLHRMWTLPTKTVPRLARIPPKKEPTEPKSERTDMSLAPAFRYADRESILSRISLVTGLDRSDGATGRYLVDWQQELSQTLGPEAEEVVPLFSELFAVKDLRAMYNYKRHSLSAQASAANHAASHLRQTLQAVEEDGQEGGRAGHLRPHMVDCYRMRFSSQIEEAHHEVRSPRLVT